MPTFRFLRNALNAYIAAREREAASYVNGALLILDDETLRNNGYNRTEMQKKPARYSVF